MRRLLKYKVRTKGIPLVCENVQKKRDPLWQCLGRRIRNRHYRQYLSPLRGEEVDAVVVVRKNPKSLPDAAAPLALNTPSPVRGIRARARDLQITRMEVIVATLAVTPTVAHIAIATEDLRDGVADRAAIDGEVVRRKGGLVGPTTVATATILPTIVTGDDIAEEIDTAEIGSPGGLKKDTVGLGNLMNIENCVPQMTRLVVVATRRSRCP